MSGAETLAKVQILNNKTMNPPKTPHQNCCFASSEICRSSTFLFTRQVSRLAGATCTSKTPRQSKNLRRWQLLPTLTGVPLHCAAMFGSAHAYLSLFANRERLRLDTVIK